MAGCATRSALAAMWPDDVLQEDGKVSTSRHSQESWLQAMIDARACAARKILQKCDQTAGCAERSALAAMRPDDVLQEDGKTSVSSRQEESWLRAVIAARACAARKILQECDQTAGCAERSALAAMWPLNMLQEDGKVSTSSRSQESWLQAVIAARACAA